ncbi:hypothetical protein PV327_010715 [Microctonus hyperodae]|uniref:Uncharacterized protein n=1 Tax=Microctonus hyperodae TaxID=165561 RepID=A0AA39C8V1_MICHY|nr:hypothetical protein PV327_010715 [Microctonus hyperodae]
MGCGQSKIGSIYSKNKKNKNNNAKNNDSIRSASIDHKNGSTKSNKTNNNEVNCNDDLACPIDKNLPKKKATGPGNGPLLQQAEMSSSQVDFFKMLDEKIENGPDYDESVDATIRAEHVTDLLRRWELASMTWSSVTELNNSTDTITTKLKNKNERERGMSAKDREGMRNIIGGRPEIVPVFTRNANRVDGLQDNNCQSTNVSRHVLESITQSPTQSLRKSTLPGASSFHSREYNNDFIGGDINFTLIDKNMEANRLRYLSQRNNSSDEDYVNPQSIYCEQYLQQTGIISVPPQFQSGNMIRNNSYVQHYQLKNNQQHFQAPKKRNFNAIEMT